MQKLDVQCASRSAHGGVVGTPASSCCAHSSIWQQVFSQFCTQILNYFGIMVRTKQSARKNTGGGVTQNSKFILYHTLFTCKYLFWLPVGLVINTCTCLYTLFVFQEGRKMKNSTKQPHIPIPSSIPRKGAGGGGGGGNGGGGVCFCENQPKSYIPYFSAIIGQKSAIHVFYCYFQQDKFWLHRQRNGEMPGTALHI